MPTLHPGLCNFLKGAIGLPAGLTMVRLYKLNPVDPQLERRLVSTLEPASENLVASLCFQTRNLYRYAMVILTGAELVTGNVMVMLSGLMTKKIEFPALARNWSLSFLGNFIGSVVMAYLAFGANTAAAPALKAAVVGLYKLNAVYP